MQEQLAQARLLKLREQQARLGIVDLVMHNGVWMTPEDAARELRRDV